MVVVTVSINKLTHSQMNTFRKRKILITERNRRRLAGAAAAPIDILHRNTLNFGHCDCTIEREPIVENHLYSLLPLNNDFDAEFVNVDLVGNINCDSDVDLCL